MLYKEIHLKNSIEKSKWNSKQCLSNPQEVRKKVILVANERLMGVYVWNLRGRCGGECRFLHLYTRVIPEPT